MAETPFDRALRGLREGADGPVDSTRHDLVSPKPTVDRLDAFSRCAWNVGCLALLALMLVAALGGAVGVWRRWALGG